MNREIKFRAWDIQQKKMVCDGDEWLPPIYRGYNEHSYPVTVTSSGIYYTKKLNNDEQQNDYYIDVHKGAKFVGSFYREWESPALYFYANDTMIPLQYTGLKDKNGKEIYEGDIVRLWLEESDCFNPGFMREYELIAKISFENGSFWFQGINRNVTDCNWHFYDRREREIIGNVYENPELL